jgi:hypothetical protein
MTDAFAHSTYLIRKKLFKVFGAACYISDGDGKEVLYADMKAFKLKEDIGLFTGPDMTAELLRIKARTVLDFSATYDVTDSATGQKVGALRRKGLKSTFLQDEWLVLDSLDNEIGTIREDSLLLALIRKNLVGLIPQKYTAEVSGSTVAHFQQNFNPFTLKLSLDFSSDMTGILDRRLGIAAGVLLTTIEGRQRSN